MSLCCSQRKIHPDSHKKSNKSKSPKSILKNRRKSIYVGNLEPVSYNRNSPKESRRDTIKKNRDELIQRKEQEREFQEKFCAEILQCGICLEKFNLCQNKIFLSVLLQYFLTLWNSW